VRNSRKDYIIERLISLALAKHDSLIIYDVEGLMPTYWQELLKVVFSSSVTANSKMESTLNLIHHKAAFEASSRDIQDIDEEIIGLKEELKKERVSEERRYWSNALVAAEVSGDELKSKEAMEKITKLTERTK
jgi:hypothetical protein